MGDLVCGAVIPIFCSVVLLFHRSPDSIAFSNIIGTFVFCMEIVFLFPSYFVSMRKDIISSGPLDWPYDLESNSKTLETAARKNFQLFSRNYSPSEEYER